MNPTPDPFRDDSPSDYLRSLVEAMRRVVEQSRDRMLAEMREAVETEAGQLDHARTEREAALRERSEADITAIATWERAEIDRIRAEAARKVQGRSRQLEEELAQLTAATNAEHAALAARADAYEREVAAFMEGLEGIDDPATFASAARRMPTPTEGTRAHIPMPAMPDAPAEPVAEPASEPMDVDASEPEPAVVEPEPAVVEPEPAPARGPEWTPEPPTVAFEAPASTPPLPAALAPSTLPAAGPPAAPALPQPVPEPEAAPVASATSPTDRNGDTASPAADQATAIQVRGLSSFGAITSFKQSLEQVAGIHSVTLGLGPSGEFVYTATHAPAIDLDAAIRSIEGTAEIAREGETVRVKVGRRTG